jgi:hypothetical protein
MQSTQSAQTRLRPRPVLPESIGTMPAESIGTKPAGPSIEAPRRERDARREIALLQQEIEQLVRVEGESAREAVDAALESVTRLQIVNANIDACGRPSASYAGAALVALADAHLRGHTDAIERGMTYTADNQIRLLLGEQ